MTRLVLVGDGGARIELNAENVELHATIDGARVVWTEHEATEIEWRSKRERTPS